MLNLNLILGPASLSLGWQGFIQQRYKLLWIGLTFPPTIDKAGLGSKESFTSLLSTASKSIPTSLTSSPCHRALGGHAYMKAHVMTVYAGWPCHAGIPGPDSAKTRHLPLCKQDQTHFFLCPFSPCPHIHRCYLILYSYCISDWGKWMFYYNTM